MGFSVGIVGLPNVGKSTLFKALTKKEIDISNYPFCTIDPNVGIVKVPDERLEKLAEFSESAKIIPTAIEFVDIAGLVKDAHKGEGLETINTELILADIETVNKRLVKTEKEARSGDKEAILFKSVLEKYKLTLENEQMANTVELDKNEKDASRGFQLLTSKPILYVVNVNENQEINKNEILPKIKNKIFLPIKFELDLSELSQEEALEFRKETSLDKNISGLDELIIKCYDLLNLMTFLTTGKDETRAWTVKKNSTAPQAGRAIHGDFEEKFIKASVINWQELLDSGSWHNAIEKGILKTEGKEYVVRDGDVVEFKI